MKLWHISQIENIDYDTYSEAVVAAETDEEAKATHPSGDNDHWGDYLDWATSPDQVTARLVGAAVVGTPPGVICASFHAG